MHHTMWQLWHQFTHHTMWQLWHQFTQSVLQSKRILIASHTRPDGDAIGSIIGIHGLVKLISGDAQVHVFQPDGIPRFLQFIYNQYVNRSIYIPVQFADPNAYDLVILVDTGVTEQIPDLKCFWNQTTAKKIIIDHHQNQDLPADMLIVSNDSASCTQLIYNGYARLDLMDKMHPEIANALYLGLCTDTGNFRFNSVNAQVFLCAQELTRHGAKPSWISENLNNMSMNQILERAEMMKTLQYDPKIKTAWIVVPYNKYPNSDLGSATYIAGMLSDAYVCLTFYEQKDGSVKISYRGKRDFPIIEIAKKRGGGGHAMAAGSLHPGPLPQAVNDIINDVYVYTEQMTVYISLS